MNISISIFISYICHVHATIIDQDVAIIFYCNLNTVLIVICVYT